MLFWQLDVFDVIVITDGVCLLAHETIVSVLFVFILACELLLVTCIKILSPDKFHEKDEMDTCNLYGHYSGIDVIKSMTRRHDDHSIPLEGRRYAFGTKPELCKASI